MEKEDCTARCTELLDSGASLLASQATTDEERIAIHKWSSEVVFFLAEILPEKHLIIKHLDRVLKNSSPSCKLEEVRGVLEGFKSQLDAGALENLFCSGFAGII